jgi:hypothetical protein
MDSVDSDEAGFTGRGGSLAGEPAEAFHAGLGFIGDAGSVTVIGLEELELDVDDGVPEDERVMKSFMDSCFIFIVVLPFSAPDGAGALNVNENDLRTPASPVGG